MKSSISISIPIPIPNPSPTKLVLLPCRPFPCPLFLWSFFLLCPSPPSCHPPDKTLTKQSCSLFRLEFFQRSLTKDKGLRAKDKKTAVADPCLRSQISDLSVSVPLCTLQNCRHFPLLGSALFLSTYNHYGMMGGFGVNNRKLLGFGGEKTKFKSISTCHWL